MFGETPIRIYTAEEFGHMKRAGQLAARTLDMIGEYVQPGVSTAELNDRCHAFILAAGATPAPLNYRGFPKSICTSVNHVVCHGIPGEQKLKDGDIINIDVTVILNGWHGDTSRMYWAGTPPVKAKRLTQVTYECMMLGIAQARHGNTVGDIGHAIQTHAEKLRYAVVEDYCGHGIGQVFHTSPNILHYGKPGEGERLREGMIFTVEPMINVGHKATRLSEHDGWTVTTKDRSLSAQFEHTIGITRTGCEIFTASPLGFTQPPYAI